MTGLQSLLLQLCAVAPLAYGQSITFFPMRLGDANPPNLFSFSCEDDESGTQISGAAYFRNGTQVMVQPAAGNSAFFTIAPETEGMYSCGPGGGSARSPPKILVGELCTHESML